MKRRFRPGLVPTLFFLVLFPLFLRLGVWQLDRAEEKRQIVEHYEQMALMEPLQFLPGNNDDVRNRRVVLKGHFLAETTFLHDNQIYQGKVGYHVFTPFQDQGSGRVVMVDRGWVAMPGLRRDILPDTDIDTSEVTIHGIIYRPLKEAISFDTQGVSGSGWPRVVQNIIPAQMSRVLGYELADYWIWLDPDEAGYGDFKREWHFVAAPPEQSTSYAVQWFSFAAILLFLYVLLNLKRQK